MRAPKAKIDLSALRHNLATVKQLAPASKIMAVVKADAYGHGIQQISLGLEQADAIAVACLKEAIALKNAGISNPVILLEGFFGEKEFTQTLNNGFETVIHQEEQLQLIESYENRREYSEFLTVWLKLDTGMNRLGLNPEEFIDAYHRLKSSSLVKSIHLMSHLACADDITNSMSSRQVEQFKKVVKEINTQKSMANSAGIIAWPESHFEWVRPGIMLYGSSPMLGLKGVEHGLKPVMTLESEVFAIKHLKAGDSVGYGAIWKAPADTVIGVVAIGYGDGYPRHAKVGTPVLVGGKRYPLVGRVSMDMITIDLGADSEVKVGDKAILWGEGLAVEEVADWAETISYTLFCGITSRVEYEYYD
ncbi:alanine racemase [Aliikangiella sp. G2MR2-5]|uniref:alanine racemase n=1 Tax=Aliikangiella sp. G2MR2-5 TaxID=2788943 RepID=UPI0018AC80DF|nr:alanine racemase [Aliikangiella sp. G2MR2-5]